MIMMVRMMLIFLLGLKIFTFEVPLAENRYRTIFEVWCSDHDYERILMDRILPQGRYLCWSESAWRSVGHEEARYGTPIVLQSRNVVVLVSD
jgi:hypothetical protein